MNNSVRIVLLLIIVILLFSSLNALELTMDKAVEIGLNNNIDLKTFNKNLEKLEKDIKIAESSFWPSAVLSASYTRLHEDPKMSAMGVSAVVGDANQNKNSLSITQVLYSGGALTLNHENSILLHKMNSITKEEIKENIIMGIEKSFLGILVLKEGKKINEKSVEIHKENFLSVKAKYEAGESPEIEMLNAEVKYKQAENSLNNVVNEIKIAKTRFKQLLKLDIDEEIEIKGTLEKQKQELKDLENSYSAALKNRKDYSAADMGVKLSKNYIKLGKTSYYPSVILNGTASYSYDFFNEKMKDDWSITLAAEWTFFEGFKKKYKVQQAELGYDISLLEKKKLEEDIKAEIKTVLLQIDNAYRAIELEQLVKEQAEKNLQIAKDQYTEGLISNLDVLNASLYYDSASFSTLQRIAEYNMKLIDYKKILGEIK